jgi:hypothetical protein
MSVAGALLALASPASAEFSSLTKSSEGEAIAFRQAIEAGGVTITCLSTSSPGTWTLEKGAEHVEKGPSLVTLIKSWGTCVAEASGISSEATVKGNECKEEYNQPKEETAGMFAFVTTCAFSVETTKKETCEVKFEAGSNKELKDVSLYDSGESDDNLNTAYNVSGVTTTVNKACESAGVKATKEGKITGGSEEKQIRPGGTPAVFTVGYSPNNVFLAINEKRKATITNGGTLSGTPTVAFEAPAAFLTWWLSLNQVACEIAYTGGLACTFEIELIHTRANDTPSGECSVKVTSPGGQVSRITYRY